MLRTARQSLRKPLSSLQTSHPRAMAQCTPSSILRRALRLATPVERRVPHRPLHASPPFLKKRRIAPAANSPPRPGQTPPRSGSGSGSGTGCDPDPENPLDLSALRAAYAPLDAHFRAQLQTVLHGGRFDPSSLGALPVAVKSAGAAETFPLRELAQVVPRPGRAVSLLVHERAFVKPIMSAVQASREFNQQPQRGDSDLELLMRVEPERREDLVRRVRDNTQAWKDRVRQARARHDKALKAWLKDGTVLPDVVRRAEREVQRAQDAKMREIEAEEATGLKQLER